MADDRQIGALHAAVTTLLRHLKIMEPNVPTEHGRLGATPSDVAALRFVAAHEGASQKALGDHLGLRATTITSLIDRLARMDLVVRTRPPGNRRVVALNLTDEGRRAFAAITEEERDTMRRMLDALPEDRRAAFVEAAGLIAARLEETTLEQYVGRIVEGEA